jgi:hypothetical protein
MIELEYSPTWFYGRDIVIDIISMLVLLLIVIFAVSSYRIGKNKSYKWLALSFTVLSLSFLFKILMNFTIYNEVIQTTNTGYAVFTQEKIISADNLFFIGYLLYRILALLGLYTLYSVYTKPNKSEVFLISVLLVMTVFLSESSYYIFHALSFLILLMISSYYIKTNYTKKNPGTKLLAGSFVIITISQLVAVFIRLNLVLYVVSEIIQLIGYAGLLLTFIMVLKHGKKTLKD